MVVGYSFRDELIAEQFARFVKSGKTLVVVGPDATASLAGVLRRVAGRGGSTKWARVDANHFAYTGGSRISVHAIQEPIRPETVNKTVATVRRAIAMRVGLVARPARGKSLGLGAAAVPQGYGTMLDRRSRPVRAGRR